MRTELNLLSHAVRTLRRSPAFALTSVATVCGALAASLAVFALSDALFVRALPVAEPERLITLSAAVSEPDIADLGGRLASLAELAASTGTPLALDLGDGPLQVEAEVVTSNYFRVAGVAPALGRTFDLRTGADAGAIVLAHGAWTRRFAADPAVVGRTVRLNGAPFTIVGVAARQFHGISSDSSPEAWVTLDSAPQTMPGWEFQGVRAERFLSLVARLEGGVSLDQLQAAATTASADLARAYPESWTGVELTAEAAAGTAPALRAALAPVLAALRVGAGALLAVAAANLALLALARAEERAGEAAVRSALGARGGDLVAPAVAESLLVAGAGALAALAVAAPLARLLASLLPELRQVELELVLDRRLALAASAGALLVAAAASAASLLAARRTSIAARLARRGAGGDARRAGGSRLRGALVAAEVALALPLVAAAILFARSLAATGAVDPGFDARGVLTLRVNTATVGYDRARGEQSLAAALDAVRATPGVTSAGAAFLLPLGFGDIARPIVSAGAPIEPEPPPVGYNVVTEGYFETLGIPLVAGRDFERTDRADTAPVVVVSRALAARLWPGQNAVGQRVELPNVRQSVRGDSYEVVGVAGDVRNVALETEAAPLFYLPWRQVYRGRLAIVARGAADARNLGPAVREAVRRADPALPTYALQHYDEYLGARLARPRALAALVGTTAAASALLAALGIAGVVAVAIQRRRRELGLRLALGATPRRAVASAAGSGLAPLAAGALLGAALTVAVARSLSGLVFGVSAGALGTALPGLVAIVALGSATSLFAARRAARLDPSQLLRGD